MTIAEERPAVTGGVDTHSELHVAAALDSGGGLLEPVDAGKLNIKQDTLRPQPLRLGNSGLTVSGLTDDLDTLRLKQHAGHLPEALMVIDDQDGQLHQTSVASPTTARTRANPCISQPTGDSPDDGSSARKLASLGRLGNP